MEKYKIITPVGNLFTDSLEKAEEYKRLYGYPYVTTKKLSKRDNKKGD